MRKARFKETQIVRVLKEVEGDCEFAKNDPCATFWWHQPDPRTLWVNV